VDRGTSLQRSTRSSVVDLDVDLVRRVVACGLPGRRWYADALPLRFRGVLDRVAGGGPPQPPPGRPLLEAGDRAGFWLVEESTPSSLALRAEVRAPGVVRLVTSWAPDGDRTRVGQSVTFEPDGWLGRAYLVADIGAREAVVELTHRRLLRDLTRP
jgi:hypothetical protein